jgi:flagellar assembly factor FliW
MTRMDQDTTTAEAGGSGGAAAIRFPQGLPGFPGLTDYRLERFPDAGGFLRLRSGAGDGPGFVVLRQPEDSGLIDRAEADEACASVGSDPADVLVLLVATARRDGAGLRLFVNRRAPVLVDSRRGLGFQVVLPRPDYAVRHPLPA